ncbi:hypothetical protein ACFYYR_05915 [Streptomyces sp. NPDC001922]|uniref:hypothetical protein n=1 Tax=Streptomyces sp. NPDC001922 TaxID=3364624 RepID=UPI00369ED353
MAKRTAGRAALIAGVMTVAVLASGCNGALSAKRDRDDKRVSQRKPATAAQVTRADAEKVMDRYERVNNAANKKQDAGLLDTIEAGNLLERDKATYEQFETLSKKDKDAYRQGFAYRKRTYLIPAGANWFAVTATPTYSKETQLVVFEKKSGTWKMTASVWPKEELPELAKGPGGRAVAVDPGTKSGPLAPNELTNAYEDVFETGGRKGGKVFGPSSTLSGTKKIHRDRGKELGPGARVTFFETEPAHTETYALKTANGGVLAIAPLSHKIETLVTRPGLEITPSDKEAVYDSRRRPVVITDLHGQGLFHLPARGRPTSLDVTYEIVDSR